MDPRLRIVLRLPLLELFNDERVVEAEPLGNLSEGEIRERLRLGVEGVVATMGKPLVWLRGTELFDWWKSEARPRLVPAACDGFYLHDFPDERCWVATEWRLADGSPVIVFTEYH